MSEKYYSGTLSGSYRCKIQRELAKKIPKLKETPDMAGLILSGILNFGNDPDRIREAASEQIGYAPGDVMISYDRIHSARRKFYVNVVTGKACGKIDFPIESLVRTFYEFVETPTPTTKEMQIKSDVRDINRYLCSEHRRPEVIGHPEIHLFGADFVAETDFIFHGTETVTVGKKKEDFYVVEGVRLFPGKPQVLEKSKVEDVAVDKRLELYVILKAMEQWYRLSGRNDDNVLLKASYYYLQKNRETPEKYSPDFFGKGGNVVSLQTRLEDIQDIDIMFWPQFEAFLAGQKISPDKCENCRFKVFCDYKKADVPLVEEVKPVTSLPELSPAQKKATEILEGNIRVIATAGSGKTTAMAYRILNLLKAGVAPEKIGCFTFTNAGANEMRDRIRGYCRISGIQADVEKIMISTLHSFGDTLLKRYHSLLGYRDYPVLINDIQITRIIESILSSNPPVKGFAEKYKNFYLDMFRAKGMLALMKDYFEAIEKGITFDDFKKQYALDDSAAKEIGKMYNQYVKYKKNACLIDHYDQERGILDLVKVKPDLFEEIGIEHVSIDEYQDTSNIQFQIINAMRQAKCVKSLFIVGDDDQSIYGFRDANVALLQNFPSMIEAEVTDISLSENRRSSQSIVSFADAVIANNADRIPKSPVSCNDRGVPVSVVPFADRESEREYIVNEVENLIRSGYKDSDIAILTPTNSELLDYAEKLAKKSIKCISINPEPVLENSNVLAAVSLVKFMIKGSEFDGVCFLNARSGGTFVEKTAEEIRKALEDLTEEMSSVKSVEQFFEKLAGLDPDGTDEIFQKFLEDLKTAKRLAISEDNLHEVMSYMIDFSRFGGKETLRKEKSYDGVVLSTMHSSKGKEWPVVICSVTKLHSRDMDPEDIPEKNRLLFVACTRAEEKLYITGVKEENYFLDECEQIAS